jgi:F420H(2)-dependent quinone reductase
VALQEGATRRDYTARELDGEEQEMWWARAVDAFLGYADLQTATSRKIPVMLLEPLS